MLTGLYHIIIIIVAVWAVVTGYRRGMMRQIGVATGVCFGIVIARLAAPECLQTVDEWVPQSLTGFNRPYLVKTLAFGGIYILVVVVIGLATIPLSKLIDALGSGILNSICGAIFKLFQFLMVLSIAYNLIADLNPDGDLTRSSRMHDGNMVEGVIKIAPAILGFPDGEEVGFRQQLEEAKKIS